MLTSSGVPWSTDEAREAGICVLLTKPVRHARLYDVPATSRDTAIAAVTGHETAPQEMVTRHTSSDQRSRTRPPLLVVEDNIVNQQVAVGLLNQLGYRAEVVANGAEAVQALSRTAFGAVLMDCQMPVMDGYEASREIRRSEGDERHIPIIAMTAGAMRADRERCLAAGMDDYISKPVDLDTLDAVLRRWVPCEHDCRDPSTHEGASPRALDPDAAAIGPASGGGARDAAGPGTGPPLGETPEPSVPAAPRFDHDQVAMLRALHVEGEPDIFAVTGQIFLDTAPGSMATLRQGIASRNAALTARAAHALKGSGANVGAAGLARACAELEAAAKLGMAVAEAEALARVEEEFRLAREWLTEQTR